MLSSKKACGDGGTAEDFQKEAKFLAKSLCKPLTGLVSSRAGAAAAMEDWLVDIVRQSMDLDEMNMCQVSDVSWVFAQTSLPCRFEPDLMEKYDGHPKTADDDGHVVLVLAPSLQKRGRSLGDNFDVSHTLVKMEVACWTQKAGTGEVRGEARGETRGEARGETRGEARGGSRGEARGESRRGTRRHSRSEARGEARGQVRGILGPMVTIRYVRK